MTERQSCPPNHCPLSYLTQKSTSVLYRGLVRKLGEAHQWDLNREPSKLELRWYYVVLLSHAVSFKCILWIMLPPKNMSFVFGFLLSVQWQCFNTTCVNTVLSSLWFLSAVRNAFFFVLAATLLSQAFCFQVIVPNIKVLA